MYTANSKKHGTLRRVPLYLAMIAALAIAPFGASAANNTCTNSSGEEVTADSSGNCSIGSYLFPGVSSSSVGTFATVDDARVKVLAGVGDSTATGVGSLAIGAGANAGGAGQSAATAVGNMASANGLSSTAIGSSASSTGFGTTSFGRTATANGDHALAIGSASNAGVTEAVAIGHSSSAAAANSVALGASSVADRANTVSVGSATAQRQIVNVAAGTTNTDVVNVSQLRPALTALGATFNVDGSVTAPSYTVQGTTQTTVGGALGVLNTAVSNNATSITNLTNNLNSGAVGLVRQASAAADITVAAGLGGTAVNFAGTGGARTLKGVTDGALSATSDEAVNGSQLFETNQNVTNNTNAITALDGRVTTNTNNITALQGQIGDISAAGVQYDDALAKTQVTLGGAGTTTAVMLTNVADGALNATSTDAVNGSQLFDTNENVSRNTSDISNLNTSVTNLDGRVTNNSTDITNLRSDLADISNGTTGLVRQDVATGNITVGSALGGTMVDFSGTGGARVLTGIANGTGDTDAVTIAQLKAAGVYDPVNDRILGALVYDDIGLGMATLGGTSGTVIANLANGSVAKGSMEAINGGQLFDLREQLQGQIDNLDGRVGTIETGIADGSIGGGGNGPISDGGGKPIQNVGDGVAPSDAATVGQVSTQVNEAIKTANNYTDAKFGALNDTINNFKGEVNQRFQQQDVKISRIGAMSTAMSQMAFSAQGINTPNRVGVGIGTQGGKNALAVGYSRSITPNVNLSFGGSASGSETSAGAGLGIGW